MRWWVDLYFNRRFSLSYLNPKVKAASWSKKKMAPPERWCCEFRAAQLYWALAKVGSGKAQTQTRMPAGLPAGRVA
jgi:hypothetical protein